LGEGGEEGGVSGCGEEEEGGAVEEGGSWGGIGGEEWRWRE
jgi:hypothetical protein